MISARLIICALIVNSSDVQIFVKLNANKVSRAHVGAAMLVLMDYIHQNWLEDYFRHSMKSSSTKTLCKSIMVDPSQMIEKFREKEDTFISYE